MTTACNKTQNYALLRARRYSNLRDTTCGMLRESTRHVATYDDAAASLRGQLGHNCAHFTRLYNMRDAALRNHFTRSVA